MTLSAAIINIYSTELADPAIYMPTIGEPVALRAVRRISADDYGVGFDAPQRRIRQFVRLQVADVAQPVRGDQIAFEGGPTVVVRDVRPQGSLEWRLEVND